MRPHKLEAVRSNSAQFTIKKSPVKKVTEKPPKIRIIGATQLGSFHKDEIVPRVASYNYLYVDNKIHQATLTFQHGDTLLIIKEMMK